MLTVILPLRVRNGHEDAIRRLDFALFDNVRPQEVGFLVVDDGLSWRQLAALPLIGEDGRLINHDGRTLNQRCFIPKSACVWSC